jgi:hypothetical protein
MKPVVYNWIDEAERKKLAADFLVQSFPESHFKPSISSNRMNLEIGILTPDFFFNKRHFLEASQNRCKGKIGASHHKVTAFLKVFMRSKWIMTTMKQFSIRLLGCHSRLKGSSVLTISQMDGVSGIQV